MSGFLSEFSRVMLEKVDPKRGTYIRYILFVVCAAVVAPSPPDCRQTSGTGIYVDRRAARW